MCPDVLGVGIGVIGGVVREVILGECVAGHVETPDFDADFVVFLGACLH